jgi:hypothetical protein
MPPKTQQSENVPKAPLLPHERFLRRLKQAPLKQTKISDKQLTLSQCLGLEPKPLPPSQKFAQIFKKSGG